MKPFSEAWYAPALPLREYVDVEVEAIATDGDGCFRVDNDDDAVLQRLPPRQCRARDVCC